MKKKFDWSMPVTWALLLIYLAMVVGPLYWLLTMSLKVPSDVMAKPPKFVFEPTFENYQRLFIGTGFSRYEVVRTNFAKAFVNTVIIAGGAVTLSLISGVLCAYALARFDFKGREGLAFRLLARRFAPALATALPLYALYRRIGLYNTHIGMILMMQLISLPLLVWVVRSYIESVPYDLEQAALVDGYSWWGSFTKVLLPLVRPGIAATSVIAFVYCWNDFGLSLLLAGRDTHSLTLETSTFISYEQVLWGQMAAAAVITILPSLILILIVQRWVVTGLTFGAVKA